MGNQQGGARKAGFLKIKKALLDIRKFFITAVSYLLLFIRVSIDNELLKNLSCLHPEQRLESGSISVVEGITRNLPFIEK